jgi:hypothetical protein
MGQKFNSIPHSHNDVCENEMEIRILFKAI